jgi:16S rRNA (guanine527-N7)-methyltransferase
MIANKPKDNNMLTPRELLYNGAAALGISLTIEQINSVFIYLTELRKWNKKINLTAIRGEEDIIIKHVLDSFSYVHGFTPVPGLRLLDMGSGAGFPAIPIKIAYPGISITLVDSIKKKASFLRHIRRTLNLMETEVLDVRTEELPGSILSTFDVVTARAFADMESAIISGIPFLRTGGCMVLSRGPQEAINDQDLAKTGAKLDRRIALTLPHSNYQRAIWVFRKPD